MKILVVNDDGIKAKGLKLLVTELNKITTDILVVAPLYEQSGVGHGITIRNKVKAMKIEDIIKGIPTYYIDSTPADCTKFAITYLKYQPDIVISGVNNGYNMGEYIFYSGTLAGAREAVFNNYKAMAFSCDFNKEENIKYFIDIYKFLSKNTYLYKADILNINIPDNPVGIMITIQGTMPYENGYIEDTEKDYFIPYHTKIIVKNSLNTDVEAVSNHYISITPLTIDQTDYKIVNNQIDK